MAPDGPARPASSNCSGSGRSRKDSIPKAAKWKPEFIAEYAAFPDGSFDDQIDPFIDAVGEICGGSLYTLDNVD